MITDSYEMDDLFLYIKNGQKLTITSVDPRDNQLIELEGVAAEMLIGLVEKGQSAADVVASISLNYDVDSTVAKKDIEDLVRFLRDKKILKLKSSSKD